MKPEVELVASRPVRGFKIKGAATYKTNAWERQSPPLPSAVVEDAKIQASGLRRDDEDASALMRRIRQLLVQRDGVRRAEKRIAEEGLVSSLPVADEPKVEGVGAETPKKDAREKLLAKLQAERALLQPVPRPNPNMDLEEMEKRLKAQAKLRIELAREKGVAVASGSVTTGMDGTVAGGLSIKGAASAAAMEQNLRSKLLSRREGVAH